MGSFNEQAASFETLPWNPLEDKHGLRVSYHDHHSSRHWMLSIPEHYPYTFLKETCQQGQSYYDVLYRPCSPVVLPGVFFPADALSFATASFSHSAGQQWQRYTQHPRIRLGVFLQFALDAFPILCPAYRIPSAIEQRGADILRLFLRATYGKPFHVGRTTFWPEDEPEKTQDIPRWAQHWVQLCQMMVAGTRVDKTIMLRLLNQLGKKGSFAYSL